MLLKLEFTMTKGQEVMLMFVSSREKELPFTEILKVTTIRFTPNQEDTNSKRKELKFSKNTNIKLYLRMAENQCNCD